MVETPVSQRIQAVAPSATVTINSLAKQLAAQGQDIINLSVGEPDFDTPDFIVKAAIEAINDGFTKYTAVDGLPELKEAIAVKFLRDNQLEFATDQIIVSAGVKQALYNLCQVLLNPGDEVIIPAPYWVSYPAMAKLASGIPVIVQTDVQDGFKLTPDALAAALTPKTKILMLNSPSNPTGATYTLQELQALAEVLDEFPQVVVACDDIYEYILWGQDSFYNIIHASAKMKARTVVLNGVSKAYAMTGWRIGYAAGPKYLIQAMKKLQGQSTSCPNSIAQKAAIAGLLKGRSTYQPMIDTFKKRHDLMYQTLTAWSLVTLLPSDGAFYLWVNVKQAIAYHDQADDLEFCALLLKKTGVAMVPGGAFGMAGFIRISCAASDQRLQEAILRLQPYWDVPD